MVHVYSQKELFNNFLAAKEKAIIKIVNDSACKVISTETVKIIERDGMVHAVEVVWYVPKTRYNLISIRSLDEEGCLIQVQ